MGGFSFNCIYLVMAHKRALVRVWYEQALFQHPSTISLSVYGPGSGHHRHPQKPAAFHAPSQAESIEPVAKTSFVISSVRRGRPSPEEPPVAQNVSSRHQKIVRIRKEIIWPAIALLSLVPSPPRARTSSSSSYSRQSIRLIHSGRAFFVQLSFVHPKNAVAAAVDGRPSVKSALNAAHGIASTESKMCLVRDAIVAGLCFVV